MTPTTSSSASSPSGETARHARPSCGHRHLIECPLTVADWNIVFIAYLGFLQQCRLVSEQAHARTERRT